MASVSEFIPVGDIAVKLPVPTLGVQLLRFYVANSSEHNPLFHPEDLYNPGYWSEHDKGSDPTAFFKALAESWAWLVSEVLIAHGPTPWGNRYFVTSRGRNLVEDSDPTARLVDEARLAPGLHRRIDTRIRQQFLIREYELAAFAALKEVEIRVRELAEAPGSLLGTKLMLAAFKPDKPYGPLTDPSLDGGERDGMMALFRGAIAVFKNPTSHRQVDYSDSTQAAEVVLFADLLLRLLDDIEARKKP